MDDVKIEDLPFEGDVAVVVFVRSRGVDIYDAATRAEDAVQRTLRLGALDSSHGTGLHLGLPHRGQQDVKGGSVEVFRVRELGAAGVNGYIGVIPTHKAAREAGRSQEDQ